MNKITVVIWEHHTKLFINKYMITINNIGLYDLLHSNPNVDIKINQLPLEDGTLSTHAFYKELIELIKIWKKED